MTSFKHKNHSIEIIETDTKCEFKVDGNSYEASRDVDSKEYNTTEMPYQTFTSFTDLAKAFVDSYDK